VSEHEAFIQKNPDIRIKVRRGTHPMQVCLAMVIIIHTGTGLITDPISKTRMG